MGVFGVWTMAHSTICRLWGPVQVLFLDLEPQGMEAAVSGP